MTLWEILQSAEVEAGCNISHNVMCRVIIYYNYWSPWNPIAACLWIFDFSHTYTYFKKRCWREWRMAVVERKLHDRKELWFPYLQKNNEFFVTTTATKTPQICIFDNGKQYFCTLCTCIFHLLTFWRRPRSFYDVKWPFLQLCGRLEHMMTNIQFCLVRSVGSDLILG